MAKRLEKNENNTFNFSTNPVNLSDVQICGMLKKMGMDTEPIVIDGERGMGAYCFYSGEEDRQNAIKAIKTILENKDGNGMRALQNTVAVAAAMHEAGVNPLKAEEDVIDGVSVIIDYSSKKIFAGKASNMSLVELANCDNMPAGVPEVAIKALLMERAKDAIHQMKAVEVTEPDYEDMDDEDDEYED